MRRRQAPKRDVIPDVKYNSEIVARLINMIMLSGKKSVAQAIVYGAFDTISSKKKEVSSIEVFNQAMENVKPKLEVKSRRVGGATYQVPMDVEPARQSALAMRWIVMYARNRKGKSMTDSLAAEIMDAYENTGNAVKKKEDTHRMAAANKAFAHYRW